jgi:hypothetical protein
MLDVPVPLFAGMESRIDEMEKAISSKLNLFCRDQSNHYLNSVTITPLTSKSTSVGPRSKPSNAEVKHIWREDYFHLFLSHVSAHKIAVSKLKHELELRGISAFVAHEDITPSLEWQNEIELALGSMQALAALLTPEFHASNWTDQEVGFALGKGVLVIPVRLGADPYGFIGKVQGISASLNESERLAADLSATLLGHPSTHRHLRKGLAAAFGKASSTAAVKVLSGLISGVTDFTDEEKMIIQRACGENAQVVTEGIGAKICEAIGVSVPSKWEEGDDVPF